MPRRDPTYNVFLKTQERVHLPPISETLGENYLAIFLA